MRYFIGIELPSQVSIELLRIQHIISEAQVCTASWVKPDNLHCTLLFLGNLTEQELRALINLLSTIRYPPFFTELEQIQVPRWSSPHLIWVTLSNNGLSDLYATLCKELPDYQETRSFTGHCTIARLKKVPNKAALKGLIESIEIALLSWEVTSFSLFSSRTEQTGAEYTLIKKYLLAR